MELATKQSQFFSRESFYVGCFFKGRYSDFGSCLRGGGDGVNLTEKVFSVLQTREAAMSTMSREYNCSARPTTVPYSRNV